MGMRRAIRMGSNLSDHQLYIDHYMQKILYINPMVTTNQKLVIHMQKIRRKEYKYVPKESQLIVREERNRELQNQSLNKE